MRHLFRAAYSAAIALLAAFLCAGAFAAGLDYSLVPSQAPAPAPRKDPPAKLPVAPQPQAPLQQAQAAEPQPPSWTQLRPVDLPASLMSASFPAYGVLDPGHSISIGRYRISVGGTYNADTLQKELLLKIVAGSGGDFVITGLTCDNPSGTKSDCSLRLTKKSLTCKLKLDYNTEFDVDCPQSVEVVPPDVERQARQPFIQARQCFTSCRDGFEACREEKSRWWRAMLEDEIQNPNLWVEQASRNARDDCAKLHGAKACRTFCNYTGD